MNRPLKILIVSLALLSIASHALATSQLEPVPLGEQTALLYQYALRVAGISVFIMFVLAGLAKMVPFIKGYVGDPTEIIKNAIIGLIILVSAYAILNSISGDLVRGGATNTSGAATNRSGLFSGARTPSPTPPTPFQGGGGSFGGGGASGDF